MRIISSIILVAFAISCTGPAKTTGTSNPLNGTWIPVKQEIGGKTIPPAAYASQKLIINDTNYTFMAESVDKGTVTRNGDKMDIYGKEGVNAGKHFMALYKFENPELSICYNLKGDKYPEALDSKGSPLYFLCVFKKE